MVTHSTNPMTAQAGCRQQTVQNQPQNIAKKFHDNMATNVDWTRTRQRGGRGVEGPLVLEEGPQTASDGLHQSFSVGD